MKNFLIAFSVVALLLFFISSADSDYRNAKRLYYDCSSATHKLVPLTPYEHKTLLESGSIDNFTCTSNKYTRFYVNLLRRKIK